MSIMELVTLGIKWAIVAAGIGFIVGTIAACIRISFTGGCGFWGTLIGFIVVLFLVVVLVVWLDVAKQPFIQLIKEFEQIYHDMSSLFS